MVRFEEAEDCKIVLGLLSGRYYLADVWFELLQLFQRRDEFCMIGCSEIVVVGENDLCALLSEAFDDLVEFACG